ncbi:hypothetical protein ACFWIN_15350, partial [Streptomyces sp. NPDC127049]|uniref:hypothetical protein n=1 Tax=Streptomyces sp. NPDC127049 TaxID=3347118 RepID=UPI003647346B
MALLYYADLDDGLCDASTLDGLEAELSEWVFGLLGNARLLARSTRPIEPFETTSGERGAEAIALKVIRLIAHAQEQLLTRNAYLRYLCSDCPRDGRGSCRRDRKPSPPKENALGSCREIRFAGLRVRSTALLPTASAVVRRCGSLGGARTWMTRVEGGGEPRASF